MGTRHANDVQAKYPHIIYKHIVYNLNYVLKQSSKLEKNRLNQKKKKRKKEKQTETKKRRQASLVVVVVHAFNPSTQMSVSSRPAWFTGLLSEFQDRLQSYREALS